MALEESDYCSRSCCGPKRAFLMHVTDGTGMDVMRINRPFKCNMHLGCYPLCGCIAWPEEAEVFSMAPGGFQGPLLAKIRIAPGCSCSMEETYHILDSNGALVYIVTGSIMQCGPNMCCQQFSFDILEPNGSHTGAYIKNLWRVHCGTRLGSRASSPFPPQARLQRPHVQQGGQPDVHLPAHRLGRAPRGHLRCVRPCRGSPNDRGLTRALSTAACTLFFDYLYLCVPSHRSFSPALTPRPARRATAPTRGAVLRRIARCKRRRRLRGDIRNLYAKR